MRTPVRHARDLVAWHGVCAVGMGVMLVADLPSSSLPAALAIFLLGAGWCVVRLARGAARAPYLRLGLCCLAMVVMLVPAVGGSAHRGGMAGHAMPSAAEPSVIALLTAAALAGFVVLGALRATLRTTSPGARAGAAGEAVLGGAMAAMLVGLV